MFPFIDSLSCRTLRKHNKVVKYLSIKSSKCELFLQLHVCYLMRDNPQQRSYSFIRNMYVQSFAVNKCFNIESFLIIFLSLRDCLIPCTAFECILGSIPYLLIYFTFFRLYLVTFSFFCSHNSHNHIHDMLISLQNIKELVLKSFTDIQC